jgi:hypothetical protein
MSELGDALFDVTKKVTKEWTKQRLAEERGRRSRCSRAYVYSDRVNFTEVCNRILPGAYEHASGDGKYSVSKRQLYYACREQFRKLTGRQLFYDYFANKLLAKYKNRNPDKVSKWKLTADPRGTLIIPNASSEIRVPVGTLAIENHLRKAGKSHGPFDDLEDLGIHIEWPSIAGGQRIQGLVYMEKEGFEPVMKEAKIAERFDVAILSCKGQSVVAARQLVDEMCAIGRGVPLLTGHDFDKYGFEIAQRLTSNSERMEENDLVKYEFKNQIDVRDLGLRLADVQKYSLEADAELHKFTGGFAADSIATKEEQEFLQSGRRVEMNAMTSPQFVEWLETRLSEELPGRLIPADDVLANAYQRALAVARVNRAIKAMTEEAIEHARSAGIPNGLRQLVDAELDESPEAWDKVLYRMVEQELED